MKIKFKKLMIRLFNLEYLTDIIKYERDKQKNLDKQYYETLLIERLDKKEREFEYVRVSLEYDIKTLEEEIKNLKIKEKEVDEKDLRAKNQINANVHMATKMFAELKECSDYLVKKTAKMHGAMDEALNHRKTVEKIEKN